MLRIINSLVSKNAIYLETGFLKNYYKIIEYQGNALSVIKKYKGICKIVNIFGGFFVDLRKTICIGAIFSWICFAYYRIEILFLFSKQRTT